MRAWQDMDGFRAERERNKLYTFGRQWEDVIEADGRKMTEAAYIRSQGSVPLKNNLIRRMVRNVLGVWRQDFKLPRAKARDPKERGLAALVNKLLDCNAHVNRLTELYARTLEEFLISGMVIHRKSYGPMRHGPDCRTDYVNPNNFFFSSAGCDFRGWDVELVGEIHQLSISRFAKEIGWPGDNFGELQKIFGVSEPDAQIKVVEVWREEEEEYVEYHDRRLGRIVSMPAAGCSGLPGDAKREWRSVWKYCFLGPRGEILSQGISPYSHRSHPYVFKIYPYIDGEVHSFVADVIDQQRHANRLITLYDWVMRSTAKGVLLFPEGALADGMDLADVADQWGRFNGVISYRARPGMAGPEQVSSTAQCSGISELLNIQLKMFEDISGVNSALQGKLESAGVSGTLFSQQTRNALIALRDILESFREFVLEATRQDACNIMQFYSAERMKNVAGEEADLSAVDLADYENVCWDFSFDS